MKKKLTFLLLLIFSLVAHANTKFDLADFAIPLEQIVSEPAHIWVTSGYTTVNPRCLTVLGVNEFYSPPFAAKDFRLNMNIVVDSLTITDSGSYGKGDVGLLYAGGTWFPHKIVRRGTYHHLKNGRLVSLGVISELIPLYGQAGIIEKVSITNRTNQPMKIKIVPDLQAGAPSVVPLKSWGFGVPRANATEAKPSSSNTWANDLTTMSCFQENTENVIPPGETFVSYFSVLLNRNNESLPDSFNAKEMEKVSTHAWKKRLVAYTRKIPSLASNIEGLDDYYKRSVISGLVCIWENPSYILNPFLSTGGIDGGATCAYLWDIAGYVPQIATLMLDSAMIDISKKMADIDLERYYAYTLDGSGVGVKYSYSPWAFTSLVSTIFKFIGPNPGLFNSAKTLILNDEKKRSENHLIDYGLQHNLLEMRGAGWEHFVVSPNAERSWCLKQLSEMGKILGCHPEEINQWENQSGIIIHAIQKELWDNKANWFASVYPDGFRDFVFSIQGFDALRAGVCTPQMETALVSHLRDGAFLGECGITSISKEDSIHYEVLDTDWSGGGAYTGDGPQLALIMYERNKPELAWDILKRHFWMGKHFIYYPQEHFADKPMSPEHKRANIVSGLAGAEAILFGLIGFQPQYDGGLFINPHPVNKGEVKITGFEYRGNSFDIELSTKEMIIFKNDTLFYNGMAKSVKLL